MPSNDRGRRLPGRAVHLVLAALLVATGVTPAAARDPAGRVVLSTVCFEVHNGAVPYRVIGTRFAAPQSDPRRVIVLVYGHSGTRRAWDWKPGYSVARRLAAAGYLVITYDRLTAGDSTVSPPRAGNTVSFDADREMLAEIVQQIRGRYPVSTRQPLGPCVFPGPHAGPNPRVILLGHSLGGGLVGSYAGAYQAVAPVDAIVQADWVNMGSSDDASSLVDSKASSPANITAGYTSLFLDDGSTPTSKRISTSTCAESRKLLLAAGARIRADAPAAVCAPGNWDPVPYADFVSAAVTDEEDTALIERTPARLPVLLVFAAEDCFFPPARSPVHPNACPSHITGGGCDAAGCQEDELTLWRTACPCRHDLSTWEEPDSGHAFMWSPTMPAFTSTVVGWLHRHRL